MQKDMTEKCDRSTCEMRWIRGQGTTHVERGVHSWTISIGFSRPTIGSGHFPAVMPMLAATPQAASEFAQTRPRSDCSVNLLLPVNGSIEPLDDDAPDVLSSGREPAGRSSEVGSDVCMVPDLLLTAVSVRTVVAEMWMERFVLVPEACPVVPMMSTVTRTFGPAWSEEYSSVVLAGGGGGGGCCGIPLIIISQIHVQRECLSCRWLSQIQRKCLSYHSLGCEFSAVFLGKVALDVVGLGVDPPCLRLDSEETLPALIDERAEMSCTVPGVTPDGGPVEGASVLEPIEHSGKAPGWLSARADACAGTVRAFGSGDCKSNQIKSNLFPYNIQHSIHVYIFTI